MKRSTYRTLRNSLIWAMVCLGIGFVALTRPLITHTPVGGGTKSILVVVGIAAVAFLLRALRAGTRMAIGIRRIRVTTMNFLADQHAVPPADITEGMPAGVARTLESLIRFQGQITRERQAPDRRLVAVLASLASGVVVVTEKGQVSLVNYPAKELLGAERARVGTSVFAALTRDSVHEAMNRAQSANAIISATFERLDGVRLQGRVSPLADGEGAALVFPPVELDEHRPEVDFDLGLHDAPPARDSLTRTTALAELPAVVLDVETTGLDAFSDRIVSLGAVCAHGARLYRNRLLDDLIDPGIPIPESSTAVHGITDDMVADGREFDQVHADLTRMLSNRVVVGHGVAFDLTVLREECARHGRSWNTPVFVDTLRLASVLDPDLKDFELETLCETYQVELQGRHTALGDALVTAEVFFRMMPRLEQHGMSTLGELLDFQDTNAVDVRKTQQRAGWISEQPRHFGVR